MTRDRFNIWLRDPDRRPLLMGVVNITPDSFSDGGLFLDAQSALDQALRLAAQGATLVDFGAESTRPGAVPVPPGEQILRLSPVLEGLARHEARSPAGLGFIRSIDTTRAQVASAALDLGAELINDVSAGMDDPDLLPLVGRRDCPIVLMHRRGDSQTIQQAPAYHDVVGDVEAHLLARADAALAAGVRRHRILLDPGIGFGKTLDHNLALLRATRRLAGHGFPLVIGTSRKSFIGTLTHQPNPADRLMGTAASVAWSATHGAGVLRVHDVDEMRQVLAVLEAIAGYGQFENEQ